MDYVTDRYLAQLLREEAREIELEKGPFNFDVEDVTPQEVWWSVSGRVVKSLLRIADRLDPEVNYRYNEI